MSNNNISKRMRSLADRSSFVCLVGRSDLADFTAWWENHLPAWLILVVLEGQAELRLQFNPYTIGAGQACIIAPDMFPQLVRRSTRFDTFYALFDCELTYDAIYDLPNSFYDALYLAPIIHAPADTSLWMQLLTTTAAGRDNLYRKPILANLLHATLLNFHSAWMQQYGDRLHGGEQPLHHNTPMQQLCLRFYDLIYDHYIEHRDTAFYAGKLCITPTYLAQITRQVCGETPKEAIDRMVLLELKYMLRHTLMTTKQMAAHLHFADPSYMGRFFRRKTGLSLMDYRNRP